LTVQRIATERETRRVVHAGSLSRAALADARMAGDRERQRP
jgi:hypothetical protein